MANELCLKCGTEMVGYYTRFRSGWTSQHSWICPLDPKDCRIKELERQLEEERHRVTCAGVHGHNPQILDCPKCVEEERDEALAQLCARDADVLALREALEHFQEQHAWDHEFSEWRCSSEEFSASLESLTNTSATSQEIVARIERELLGRLGTRVQHDLGCWSSAWTPPRYELCNCAAILGEKEK